MLAAVHIRLVEAGEFRADQREEGRDWPVDAESMVGLKRIANTPPLRRDRDRVTACRATSSRPASGAAAPPSSCAPCSRPTASPTARSGSPTPSRACRRRARSTRPTWATTSTRRELAVSLDEVKDELRALRPARRPGPLPPGWFSDTLPRLRSSSSPCSASTATCTPRRSMRSTPLYDKSPPAASSSSTTTAHPGLRQGGPRLPRPARITDPIERDRLDRRLLAQGAVVTADDAGVRAAADPVDLAPGLGSGLHAGAAPADVPRPACRSGPDRRRARLGQPSCGWRERLAAGPRRPAPAPELARTLGVAECCPGSLAARPIAGFAAWWDGSGALADPPDRASAAE